MHRHVFTFPTFNLISVIWPRLSPRINITSIMVFGQDRCNRLVSWPLWPCTWNMNVWSLWKNSRDSLLVRGKKNEVRRSIYLSVPTFECLIIRNPWTLFFELFFISLLPLVKVDLDNNITDFQISIEEFLHGVVSLTNELVNPHPPLGHTMRMLNKWRQPRHAPTIAPIDVTNWKCWSFLSLHIDNI